MAAWPTTVAVRATCAACGCAGEASLLASLDEGTDQPPPPGALAPNRVWVTDFTYVRSWVGWVHVAFILDVFAQRIVAWHAATAKDVELVMTPLRMAIWQRDHDGRPVVGEELMHLVLEGIRPSIGAVGDAYDNALMETLNREPQPA